MRGAWWLSMAVLVSGCDLLEGIGSDPVIVPPEGELVGVELVRAPNLLDVLAWQCNEQGLGIACAAVGPRPLAEDLVIGFDIDFDVENPNISVPIPMVEALVGLTVFEETNLGAVCVSFCDPDDPSCEAQTDREGDCEGGTDVLNPSDLLPTVPELLELTDGSDGTYVNDEWRLLLAGDTTRVTLGFELAPDVVLDLGDDLVQDSLDDLLEGRVPELTIPYTTEGTLFFDVPEIGRRAIGFGPFDAAWPLELPEE